MNSQGTVLNESKLTKNSQTVMGTGTRVWVPVFMAIFLHYS